MGDDDYRDHLRAAREHMSEGGDGSEERAETALMWAAVSALCAIADRPAPVEARPKSSERSDNYLVDSDGVGWLRLAGTDRYVRSTTPSINLESLRRTYGVRAEW